MASSKYSPWSNWEWDNDHQRNVSSRYDDHGDVEYAYDPQFGDPLDTQNITCDLMSTMDNNLATSFETYSSPYYQTSLETENWAPESLTPYSYRTAQDSAPLSSDRRITTKDINTIVDEIDPEFMVHSSKHFKFGRIFKVLWSEPLGSSGTQITGTRERRNTKYGEPAYHSIRRFLVVDDSSAGHSLCLPILTYGGRATKRNGVRPEDHAIIHTSKQPVQQKGEKPGKKPVRVKPKSERHKLDPNSRLNYAKLYTVEHNVKVSFIGYVIPEHEQRVVEDFRDSHMPLEDRPYHASEYEASEDTVQDTVRLKHTAVDFPTASYSEPPVVGGLQKLDKARAHSQTAIREDWQSKTPKESERIPTLVFEDHDASLTHAPESAQLPQLEKLQKIEKKEKAPSKLTRSRSSSTSSSGFSDDSPSISSSISSLYESSLKQPDWPDRVYALFSQNEEFRRLYYVAAQKTTFEEFEERINKSLLRFGKLFYTEAETKAEKLAAQIIQNNARHTAHRIRLDLESEKESRKGDLPPSRGYQDFRLNDEDFDEDDEQADEVIEVDDSSPDILGEIQEILLRSNSFGLLLENIYLLIHPDSARMALLKLWPSIIHRDSKYSIRIDLEWELTEFLESSFDPTVRLAEIMTLSGGAVDAQASSCRDYLLNTWPRVGILVLELLESSIRTLSNVKTQNNSIQLQLNQTTLKEPSGYKTSHYIIALADYDLHVEILHVLSWICAAVRGSTSYKPSTSTTSIKAIRTDGKDKIVLKPDKLQNLEASLSCWHGMFPYGVIAYGYPIAKRRQGKGLEISFADMASLSKSVGFTHHDKGLLLESLRSVLIPVTDLATDNAIQWHLQRVGSCRSAEIANILSTKDMKQWFKVLEPYKLIERRAFLGFVPEAHIVMGTEFYRNTIVSSRAEPSTIMYRGFPLNLGSFGLKYLREGLVQYRSTASRPLHVEEDETELLDTLAQDKNDHIVICDTQNKTAWLLPKVNVVLFILQDIISNREYQVFDGETPPAPVRVRHAEASTKCAEDALEILEEATRFTFQRPRTRRNLGLDRLARLISKIWFNLTDLGRYLASAVPDIDRVGEGSPQYLHGIEFEDVLGAQKKTNEVKIRKIELSQPWKKILPEQPTILFCTGLEQPIKPLRTENLCKCRHNFPLQQNKLVVTGSGLLGYLLERDGSFYDTTIRWCYTDPLLQVKDCTAECAVDHTQTLQFSPESAPANGKILEKLKYHRHSAFVFSGIDLKQQNLINSVSLGDTNSTTSSCDACDKENLMQGSISDSEASLGSLEDVCANDGENSHVVHRRRHESCALTRLNATIPSLQIPIGPEPETVNGKWQRRVVLYDRVKRIFLPGNAMIDPGNTGPNLITESAMRKANGVPTNCKLEVQMFDGEFKEVGGLVEMSFAAPEANSRFWTKNFRHVEALPEGFQILLGRDFCDEAWPDMIPGLLHIRAAKKKISNEQKEKKRREENERQKRQEENAKKQEEKRKQKIKDGEEKRLAV